MSLDGLKNLANFFEQETQTNQTFNDIYMGVIGKVLQSDTVVSKEEERTGTGTIKCFGDVNFSLDLMDGFPLLNLKHVSHKQAIGEMMWMMNGFTDTRSLKALGGGNIWDQWAKDFQLGPIYGKQWREVQTYDNKVDQLKTVFRNLLVNPFSRRHVVSAWNPLFLPREKQSAQTNVALGRMALAPCHHEFQFNVSRMTSHAAAARWNVFNQDDPVDYLIVENPTDDTPPVSDLRLDLKFSMRSNDVFLGLPYNVVGYAYMLHAFAYCLGYQPGKLHYSGGDVHIYLNHLEQIEELYRRYEMYRNDTSMFGKTELVISTDDFIPSEGKLLPFNITPPNVSVLNYNHLKVLKAIVAV